MRTLDPDRLPRTGLWEGVLNDLSSRGSLAGGGIVLASSGPVGLVASLCIVLAVIAVAFRIAIRQLREQSTTAVELGRQVRERYADRSASRLAP